MCKEISVLIASYNRSELLCETLTNFTKLDLNGLSVEFVIIDNNSSDDTCQIVDSFKDKLPLRYLFESRAGKNCALNKALNEVELGNLVVFTDDDVKPHSDWLQRIMDVSNRWPSVSVFGGKIYPIFPEKTVLPDWIEVTFIRKMVLVEHDWTDQECFYDISTSYPFGPNYWVRKEIFVDGGRRFNEQIGPNPKKRIMGSETSFLKRLAETDKFKIFHSPDAIVGHYIEKESLTQDFLVTRAKTFGRSMPHLYGIYHNKLYRNSYYLWIIYHIISAGYSYLKLCGSFLTQPISDSIVNQILIYSEIEGKKESLFIGREKKRDTVLGASNSR
ncbi:MAG: glycosyltransferase family 2 protein [Desulfobulbaceae bacterium]|nr:glycosyltransferase family 2 protein [Desulfobulbaceae bacterium]